MENLIFEMFPPPDEEKCFVEEIHRDMHGERIVAKKSKPPVKVEKAGVKKETEVVKEGAQTSDTVETAPSEKEGVGIDAVRFLMAVGVVLILVDFGVLLLRYVYHMI
jgi:hypothetical protein